MKTTHTSRWFVLLVVSFTMMLAGVSLLLFAGASAAQPGNTSAPNSTATEAPGIPGERIGPEVSLISSEYNDGVVTVTLYAQSATAVTITEASGARQSQELNRRTFVLEEGRNTISIGAERHAGYAAVTISTTDVVWLEVVETRISLIGPPWSARDVQVGVLVASIGTGLGAITFLIRRYSGSNAEVEKLA